MRSCGFRRIDHNVLGGTLSTGAAIESLTQSYLNYYGEAAYPFGESRAYAEQIMRTIRCGW